MYLGNPLVLYHPPRSVCSVSDRTDIYSTVDFHHSTGIDILDFQEALEEDKRLNIAFCRRIMSDQGTTGLIRVFSHDIETIHLLLTEGAFAAGRHFRTEESRQTEPHIPYPLSLIHI